MWLEYLIDTQETKEPCISNFWYVLKRFSSSKSRHTTLNWASQRFPIQGIDHLTFSNTRWYTIPIQGSPCIGKRSVCQVQYKVKTYPGIITIQGVPLSESHQIQGILPCIGLCLFPNTRWRHFAIQGCPCIEFLLYYDMCQSKVMSCFQYNKVTIYSNSRSPLYWFLWYYVSSQYKVTMFCNSRLTLFWFIVPVKWTYDIM